MATPNYGWEKRQRELAKKKKKEEKAHRKAEQKQGGGAPAGPGDGERAPADVTPPAPDSAG